MIRQLFWLILFAFCAVGCALNRPLISEKNSTTFTNGVVNASERSVKVTTFALWPAQTDVSKQRASAGKTLSTGADAIAIEGTGGTNGVEALKQLNQILQRVGF